MKKLRTAIVTALLSFAVSVPVLAAYSVHLYNNDPDMDTVTIMAMEPDAGWADADTGGAWTGVPMTSLGDGWWVFDGLTKDPVTTNYCIVLLNSTDTKRWLYASYGGQPHEERHSGDKRWLVTAVPDGAEPHVGGAGIVEHPVSAFATKAEAEAFLGITPEVITPAAPPLEIKGSDSPKTGSASLLIVGIAALASAAGLFGLKRRTK
jgi:LPXTG-motif cell wall-anchored protein